MIRLATEIWTYQDRRLSELDLSGFQVETRDGVVGRVDRATKDVSGSYLVIDPGASMPLGRRLLVPAGIVDTVDMNDRRIFVDASRNDLLSAPEFNPQQRSLDADLRDRIGAHFSRGRRPRSQGARATTSRSRASKARGRSTTTRGRSRSTTNEGPTKEQLYQQAKRLRIEGRSKMNKAQLKRAVNRRK